jgi:hypothetical protein
MMHGRGKSDFAIVAVKPANKAEHPAEQSAAEVTAAEPVERRAETKGNAGRQSTCRTQSRASVSQALERIRQTFAVMTRGKSRMRESCMYGSARGAPSNGRPYRDQHGLLSYGPNVDDMTHRAVAYIDRGRQVLRSAGAAADQIRAGDQPQDCEGARPRRPSDAARTRRRGDRVRRGATTAVGHSQAREADCEPANRACVTTSRRYCRACPRSWLQWLLLTKRPERKCSC